ncbi:hypothetical protein Tco_0453223 [Tanacetum coccineum]
MQRPKVIDDVVFCMPLVRGYGKHDCRRMGYQRSFGRHLEEIHVTLAQFGKKQDKNSTLHDFDQEMAYSAWRQRHNFS